TAGGATCGRAAEPTCGEGSVCGRALRAGPELPNSLRAPAILTPATTIGRTAIGPRRVASCRPTFQVGTLTIDTCGCIHVDILGVSMRTSPNVKAELLQGTLDLLILKTVALGPVHGYSIAQRIQQISKDVLHVRQGSLYPALHRLEERGLLDAQWGETET